MTIIEHGHVYELDNFESAGKQHLQFMRKSTITPDSNEMEQTMEGTTNEEVLKVLIDRMQFLQTQLSSRENAVVITKLEEALMWLEKRTANRKAKGVEGTNNA